MQDSLLGGSVLSDGLGTLRDGVLSELTWEEETDSSLDFSGREGCLIVVTNEATSFECETLEEIVDERVHDCHSTARDTSIWVNLLQHLVDVRRVSLNTLLTARLRALRRGGLLWGLLSFHCHVESKNEAQYSVSLL